MSDARPRTARVALPALGSEPSARRDRAALVGAFALLALAAAAITLGPSPWVRRLVPVAFAFGAVALFARRLVPETRPGWRGVRIDEGGRLGLVGRDGPVGPSLDLARPFGVTWLADRGRTRAVLAITGEEGALYLGARFDGEARRVHADLLGRAATLADEEPALEPAGPDGAPFELAPRALARLDAELRRLDPDAPRRCFLSDTRGHAVELDRDVLRVGEHAFDLSAPLEWRALLFQEAVGTPASLVSDRLAAARTGGVITVYQGTWIRQAGQEAILVSLLPALSSVRASPWAGAESPEIERAVLRDIRLMQAAPELPPPRDLRVGIERAYMLPLRVALDRAPRARRTGAPSASVH